MLTLTDHGLLCSILTVIDVDRYSGHYQYLPVYTVTRMAVTIAHTFLSL